MDDAVRATALVSGQVQGVGFREWTRCRAERLGLAGSATNLSDGRVEVHAEGPRPAVEGLLDAMRGGESPGRVDAVDVTWAPPTGEHRFRTG